MNVLVTGANGYLGNHLVRLLESNGHCVEGMNSHWKKTYGVLDVSGAIQNADAVAHLAWLSSPGDKYHLAHTYCLDSTKRLLHVVRRVGRPRCHVVFASTASVYGDSGDREFLESDAPAPNCAYTKAKYRAEKLVADIGGKHGCTFRFGSFMGVGAMSCRTKLDAVVNAFAYDGYRVGRIEVWNPESWKPVIHVKDAAELIVRAVELGIRGTVNACCGSYPAKHIAGVVSSLTGADVVEIEDRTGPRSCRMNCDFMRNLKTEYRTLTDAVVEFEGYIERPEDRTTPWK